MRSAKRPVERRPVWASGFVIVAITKLAVSAVSPLSAQDPPGVHVGAIDGLVFDQDTREWIEGAEVRVEGMDDPAFTDREGHFRIDGIPVGWYRVLIRRIGYEARVDTISIPTNSVLAVQISLARQPVVLQPLEIVVRSATLERNGFYERAQQGYSGVYLDRAKIEEMRAGSVTHLFQGINGIRVIYDGLYGARVLVNQVVSVVDTVHGGGCQPAFWIDGVRSTMRSPDVMRLDELEGVEIYRRAGAPGKFIDPCGTILFWTRVPTK